MHEDFGRGSACSCTRGGGSRYVESGAGGRWDSEEDRDDEGRDRTG